MTVNKRKKVTKYRGSKTHGGGSMKKRRGAGHRGGRGRAGSGKRGDAKKPTYQKAGKGYLGKNGFVSKSRKKIKAVNIETIQQKIETYVKEKLISEKSGVYLIDLAKLGYNKLLGTGNVMFKMEITCDSASAKAVEKVGKAGGKVVLPAVEETLGTESSGAQKTKSSREPKVEKKAPEKKDVIEDPEAVDEPEEANDEVVENSTKN